jgi:hypothetical protein
LKTNNNEKSRFRQKKDQRNQNKSTVYTMQPEELLNEGNESQKPAADSPLLSLERDLKIFKDSIHEVAVEIMMEGLSSYPIFIAHQHELKLGEVILDRNDLNSEWSIHASTLEEFTERGVIKPELKDRVR